MASYLFDAKAVCTGGGRSAVDITNLSVFVLGNPTLSDEVAVEIREAEGRMLTLKLTNSRGDVTQQVQVPNAVVVERQVLKLGQVAGIYYDNTGKNGQDFATIK